MQHSDLKYLLLIVAHIFIGFAIFYVPFFPKIYGFSIILFGILYVIKAKNQNNEVLYAAAYIVGSEVVLRMTNGNPIYEFSKYGVMMFILIGMYFSGLSKNAIPYWLFIILLVPGLIISSYSFIDPAAFRKEASFNISGPICLAIASLYTYTRKISLEQLHRILLMVGLPTITCVVYMTLYTPNLRDIITGTGSNVEASGGFGPNQVSTILGLGIFIFVSRMIYKSKNKFIFLINLVVVFYLTFRGLITFSRGGIITAIVMIVVLLGFTYVKVGRSARLKLNVLAISVFLLMAATWAYSSDQTGGLIEKRYANEDARGNSKKTRFTGREDLAAHEIETFLKHPIFGVGVGMNTEIRYQETGMFILSHNEISRMLAEHGAFGIMGLIILIFTPLFLYLDNKFNVFLVCFVAFWLLTINHAAMRLAAPAFIYSLSLLKITLPNEKPIVHRE